MNGDEKEGRYTMRTTCAYSTIECFAMGTFGSSSTNRANIRIVSFSKPGDISVGKGLTDKSEKDARAESESPRPGLQTAPAQNEVYLMLFVSVGNTSAKRVTSYPASSVRMAVESPTTPTEVCSEVLGSEQHAK